MVLPSFEPEECLKLLIEFLKIEKDWVSNDDSKALYLRPFAFSTTNYLGLGKPISSKIMITASPVSEYFETDEIKLTVDETFWRNNPMNVSRFKVSPNYAPTMALTSKSMQKGYA